MAKKLSGNGDQTDDAECGMAWWRAALIMTAVVPILGTGAHAQQGKQRLQDPVQVRIADADCQWLARHHPTPDVAYEPGVSTTGRAVAPADLGGRPPLTLPEVYTFAIGREILDQPGNTKADLAIGTVYLDMTNQRLSFNGQPLSAPLEDELVALCRE
jgi:hypothetical protein